MTKHHLHVRVTPVGFVTAIGILSIVVLGGILLAFSAPGRALAAGRMKPSNQTAAATSQSVAEPGGNQPFAGYDIQAPIGSTLLDFQLPGTQPGGLSAAPLVNAGSCTGCHVDHIKDNFNGAMMTNGVRDPLFRAALVIANNDAGFGGDLCIRCHSPNAWLNGRSADANDPASTDGRFINADDLHGISCSACHRMVPTHALTGEASGDAAERAALGPGPFLAADGAYIIDRNDVRRGPFSIASAPHTVAQSSFLQSAEICATCHDIDNPLLTFDSSTNEFKLNDLNTPVAVTDRLFPLDRSYSEWLMSDFADGGVTGLDYPGLKRAGGTQNSPITVCQDCHMPMVSSKIANGGVDRTVGQHQWLGANTTWQDGIIQVWDPVAGDTQFDAVQTAANKTLSESLLKRAAQLDIAIVNGQLEVKVTNNTGHKLPTGYAEGRRMWIEVYELNGATAVFTSGLMGGAVGPLIDDPYLKKYEAKMGLSDAHATAIGRSELAGEGFHIILNNKIFKDNRIPPRGFTNADFATRDMQPVGASYADGQYWDTTYYPIHPEATSISVRLMYQTASSEYLDFLASEANLNVTDAVRGTTNWGQIITDLRAMNIGKPVAMAAKAIALPREFVATTGTDSGTCTDSTAPCRTITYAVSQAAAGTEIRVAAGVYPDEIQLSIPISLTGGFTLTNWATPDWTANVTVLDGQNSHRPLTINADNVRINGFVIRNGNATAAALRAATGGGIYVGGVNKVDFATLLNLRLENNVASTVDGGEGGGLMADLGNTFNITGLLALNNVTVRNNTASTGSLGSAGGGMSIHALGNSSLMVTMNNITVQDNTAGNDFSSSGGGMALNLQGGTATISQSRILDNHAAQVKTLLGGPSRGGGIYASDSRVELVNVLIAGNDGERGDAISAQSGGAVSTTLSLNYVTLADNYHAANDARAAIQGDGTDIQFVIANTLISGNPLAIEALNNNQPLPVSFDSVLVDDNVTTIFSGTVNSSGTPLRGSAAYVNAGAGDYHLSAASDAIDQGNDQPPLNDLDGAVRPQGAGSDIGAFEFTPPNLQNQTITFGPLADKLVTDPPFTISASASSGLPVGFTSRTTAVCTISGSTVTLVTTGTCTIEANQPGNSSFNPAPPVSQNFAVKSTGKTDQTITFAQPGNKAVSDPPFALSASASSGLPVSFVSNTPAVCTVNGNTVTLHTTGNCSITATQNGNATFNPATPVTRSFSVLAQGVSKAKLYLPRLHH